MTNTYDALIIGAGQAGPPLAGRVAAPAAPCTPPFRAPALFGRLLLARVEGVVMQTSENLHRSGRFGKVLAMALA